MKTRREALTTALAGTTLLGAGTFATGAQAWTRAAFEAKSVQDAVRALGGGPLAESREVTISGPEISENGAVVPIAIGTTLAGAKQLALLVEKNPGVLVAVFNLSDAIEPSFSTRAKMSESSMAYAVAITRDGKAFFARREIKVTLGGCG
jgi:sulfur-oxidizing protein SoxY